MNELFLIYLYTVATKIPGILLVIGMIVGLATLIWAMAEYEYGADETKKAIMGWTKFAVMVLLAGALSDALIPQRKDIALIIGGGVAFKAAQNESVQELPENIINAMNAFLEGIATNEETD